MNRYSYTSTSKPPFKLVFICADRIQIDLDELGRKSDLLIGRVEHTMERLRKEYNADTFTYKIEEKKRPKKRIYKLRFFRKEYLSGEK